MLNHLGAEYLRHAGHQLDADLLRLGTINLTRQIILTFQKITFVFILTIFKNELNKKGLTFDLIAMAKL